MQCNASKLNVACRLPVAVCLACLFAFLRVFDSRDEIPTMRFPRGKLTGAILTPLLLSVSRRVAERYCVALVHATTEMKRIRHRDTAAAAA